jgi:hypothetical protein
MVWHKAPCQNIGIRQNIPFDLLQKEIVIFFPEKYPLPVISLIVDMVYVSLLKIHGLTVVKTFKAVRFLIAFLV